MRDETMSLSLLYKSKLIEPEADCVFLTGAERAVIKGGIKDGSKVVNHVPSNLGGGRRLQAGSASVNSCFRLSIESVA
jgi:hypothetical protein